MSTTYDSHGPTAAASATKRSTLGRIPDLPRDIPAERESPVLLSLPDVTEKTAAPLPMAAASASATPRTPEAIPSETGTTSATARRQRAEQRKMRRQTEPQRGSLFQGSGRLIVLALVLGVVAILVMVSNRNRNSGLPVDDSAERWGNAAAKKPTAEPPDSTADQDMARSGDEDARSRSSGTRQPPPSADEEVGPSIAPPGTGADRNSATSNSVHAASPSRLHSSSGVRTAGRRETVHEPAPPTGRADGLPSYPDTHAQPFPSQVDRTIRR